MPLMVIFISLVKRKEKPCRFLSVVYVAFLVESSIIQYKGSLIEVIERVNRIKENKINGYNNINLIPFRDVIYQFEYNVTSRIFVLGMNYLLFIPLGIILRRLSFTKMVILANIFVISKEYIQYMLCTGVFDVDDIALNILGIISGWVIYKLLGDTEAS